ncbi:MAG: hypothetical protein QOI03_2443, partial [Solirubrobacteraceae bacterium]|nr:hypothetical protein [Solirubrobacteraceae bacterium]
LGAVEVATLARLADPDPGPLAGSAVDQLARAGRTLPWRRWLDDPQALARTRAA